MPSQERLPIFYKGLFMSYEKSIYKLLPDVRDLITNGKESVDPKNLQKFVDTLKEEALRFLDPEERTRSSK